MLRVPFRVLVLLPTGLCNLRYHQKWGKLPFMYVRSKVYENISQYGSGCGPLHLFPATTTFSIFCPLAHSQTCHISSQKVLRHLISIFYGFRSTSLRSFNLSSLIVIFTLFSYIFDTLCVSRMLYCRILIYNYSHLWDTVFKGFYHISSTFFALIVVFLPSPLHFHSFDHFSLRFHVLAREIVSKQLV